MPETDISADMLKLKELELNMLLEMIREINKGASEDRLARLYRLTVNANRLVKKMAIYMLASEEKQFELLHNASFGIKHHYRNLPLTDYIKSLSGISNTLTGQPFFEEFDQVVPIKNEGHTIAYLFLGFDPEQSFRHANFEFVYALCSIVVTAIYNRRISNREKNEQEYTGQIKIAKEVQGLLVPKRLPKTDKLQVEATYKPHYQIGGDYYDCIDLGQGKFLLCIADVSGKGVPAALIMSNFQAGLRLLSKRGMGLSEIVQEINSFVAEVSSEGRFITAFFAVYDPEKQHIQYVNAGHNPPFYWAKNTWQRLEDGCTVLGAFSELPFLDLGTVPAEPPFLLFAFTDGFVESPTLANGLPLDEGYLQQFLNNKKDADLAETHQTLIRLIDNAEENAKRNSIDDITLLSFRVNA